MPTQFSFQRSIFSYHKVQTIVGNLVRNRKFQLQSKRAKSLKYLDVGCGPNSQENFINLEYLWHQGIDVCWDITQGLPFADGSMDGIFTEHCLEHFPLETAVGIFREFRRVLRPGGILRMVVPDGGLYLDTYHRQINGDNGKSFPYQDSQSFEGVFSPIFSVNRLFYQDRRSLFGHRLIFDADSASQLLRHCGFAWAKKESYRQGRDRTLLIDVEHRKCESLYVEAGVAGP